MTKMGDCARRRIPQQPAMVEDFLQLGGGGGALLCAQVSFGADGEGEEQDFRSALLSIAAEELLEAWVGAERSEVGAGVNGGKIAETLLEG